MKRPCPAWGLTKGLEMKRCRFLTIREKITVAGSVTNGEEFLKDN